MHIMYDECQAKISMGDDGFYFETSDGTKRQCYGIFYVKIGLPPNNKLEGLPFLPHRLNGKSYVFYCYLYIFYNIN